MPSGKAVSVLKAMSAEPTEINLDYVANLARIRLTPEEKETYGSQLGSILEYFQKLREVDVDGIEPMAHAFDLANVWGEDIAEAGLSPEAGLQNAPAQREQQIVVPKVVEDA